MTTVRPAGLQDVAGVYRVCLLTGASGEDASLRHSNPDLLGHVYAGPYLASAPEHALVAVDSEGVAGYCLVAPDTRAFESWAEQVWWPPLREQYPLAGTGADAELIAYLHHPPRADDDVVRLFPAHLHIDLLDRARGTGLGRLLIERQASLLRARGVAGVHLELAADNANARAFYAHLGFTRLAERDSSTVMGLPLR